ncbi:flavoprotein-like protein [Umbelopsis sp. AD052]|nr:flavoprotein-like protein [Umbelopsis sp. AD052]
MAPKIAIVYYSLYGHIGSLAKSVAKGVTAAGGAADLFQIPETLSEDVLQKMHAPPRDTTIPDITPEKLAEYDGFLLGVPTRYGNSVAQWRQFWDQTGGLWAKGALHGKFAGIFVSTGTVGGGQEVTALNNISTLAHHGIIYVPLGYKNTFPQFADVNVVRGGSAWGAGTFAAADGSRQVSDVEHTVAEIQGKTFYETLAKHQF